MNDLVVFYLLTSATYVFPMVFITLNLIYGIPVPFLMHVLGDLPPIKRALRDLGTARLENFSQLFDRDTMKYLTRYSTMVCMFQLVTVVLIIAALLNDMPLPFFPNTNDHLSAGMLFDLMMFTTVTSVIHLMPLVLLLLFLLYDIPIPFMPLPPRNSEPSRIEITLWEQESEDFASIRLTRFENPEKTVFLGNIRYDRSGTVFKLVLVQGKEVGDRTECYLYTDDKPSLKKIIPTPVTVDELEKIFRAGYE